MGEFDWATDAVSFRIPSVPKSLNQVSKAAHWSVFQNEKKRLEGEMFIAMLEAKVPKPLVRVHAEAVLNFKTHRRRDEGNYRSILEKALGDTLQLQWLPDDTPEHFTFGAVQFEKIAGSVGTLIAMRVQRA